MRDRRCLPIEWWDFAGISSSVKYRGFRFLSSQKEESSTEWGSLRLCSQERGCICSCSLLYLFQRSDGRWRLNWIDILWFGKSQDSKPTEIDIIMKFYHGMLVATQCLRIVCDCATRQSQKMVVNSSQTLGIGDQKFGEDAIGGFVQLV